VEIGWRGIVDRTSSSTAFQRQAVRPAAAGSSLGLRSAFHFFLLFYFGAFGLTMWRKGMNGVVSPLLMLGGLFAIGLILSSPRCMALLSRCWPLLVLCGLALVSTAWSVNPSGTLNRAIQYTFGTLLGVAMMGTLGSREGLRLIIRSLSLLCVLSLIWAVLLPDLGVHQPYEQAQTVHAGLWRGVFSHKISLGTLGGVTFGLLLFYGWRAFSNWIFYPVSLVVSAICLVMSGSATGVMSAIVMATLLFVSYRVVRQGARVRRPLVRIITLSLSLIVASTFSGALDNLVVLLGRSSDLTGRAEYWPHVLDFIHADNRLLGYGYSQFSYVGVAIQDNAGMYLGEAHNGFLEMVVDFGYPGALIVVLVFFHLLWRMGRELTLAPVYAARMAVFPFSLTATLLVSSYAESIILEYRGMWTMLLTVAVCLHVSLIAAQRETAGGGGLRMPRQVST
jgi:O-antigen ligase